MKNKILVTYILFFSITNLVAQETLSLQQALKKAIENNFNIKISTIEKEKAQSQNTIGNAGMLPSVNLMVGQQQKLQNQNNPNSVLQGQIFTANTAPTIEVNWNLFNGFLARANKSKLEQLEVMSYNNSELVLQNTLQAVVLAYYRSKTEQHKVEALRHTLTTSRVNANRTKKKADLGVISSFDALQDHNNYLTDSSNYTQQIQSYENSIRIFNYLLVDSNEYVLENTPQKFHPFNLDSTLNTTNDIPSIKSYLINEQLLKYNKKIASSNLYPTLSMSLGSNITSTYVKTDQFNFRPAPSWQSYINFTLNFNLFNGGKTKIAIKNAEQDIQIQTLKIKDAENNIKMELMNAYQLYKNSTIVLAIEKNKLTNSEKLLNQAQRKFELGTLNSFDYRKIQLNHTLNELNIHNLEFNTLKNYLDLLQLSGQINLKRLSQL